MYMSNFKIKKNKVKKKIIKDNCTLDKKHKEKINIFTKNNKTKEQLEKKINKIKEKLELIKFSTDKKNIEKKTILLKELDNYETKIIKIKKTNEMNYFDKTGELLNKYYNDNTENNSNITKKKSILELFTNNTKKKKNNKSKLFEDYCMITDGIKIKKDNLTNRIKTCNLCKIEKIYDMNNSSYTCTKCGDMELVILDDDNKIKEYSCYKRVSHFKEWLLQFQAKEATNINADIYNNIVEELKKNRIFDPKKINRKKLQKILFKLGYSNLYEHIPYIINKISNIPPPKITQETEEKFYKMFKSIQEPWELYKPKGRKNIISYSYIIYKFCELLELDHLLKYFPLLKSSKKIQEHDIIWKKVCNYLKWEFYPTNI